MGESNQIWFGRQYCLERRLDGLCLGMHREVQHTRKYVSKFFRFGWVALPPRPPRFWLGGAKPPRAAMETHPVHEYWEQLDVSCHQWGFCDDRFQPQQLEHVTNTFNFHGFSHFLFPDIHLKSLSSVSMFISICCKYMLTNKLLTQRGLPFSLHGKPESMKNHPKSNEKQWKFKDFSNLSNL